MAFSDWLWHSHQKTSGLSPEALVDALSTYLNTQTPLEARTIQNALLADYLASGARANPQALQGLLPKYAAASKPGATALTQRQERHQA